MREIVKIEIPTSFPVSKCDIAVEVVDGKIVLTIGKYSCDWCSNLFKPKRKGEKFDRPNCRKTKHRKG